MPLQIDLIFYMSNILARFQKPYNALDKKQT